MMNETRHGGTVEIGAATPMLTAERLGWVILVGLGALLTANGVLLYSMIVQTPQEQTLAILLTGFGALSLMVALGGFRHSTEWAWNGTWVVVALLATITLHFFRVGAQPHVAAFYLVLTVIALAGQLLVLRGRISRFTATKRG
jgi:hypothetical protein